jgi:hypothetical protein
MVYSALGLPKCGYLESLGIDGEQSLVVGLPEHLGNDVGINHYVERGQLLRRETLGEKNEQIAPKI